MAVNKNKCLMKGGKKGAKKKGVDPFSKKDFTRTQGNKIALTASGGSSKSCVFEVSFADLQNHEVAFRKFKVTTEDIMTEVHIDVKTTRGYLLHLLCVGFTKKRNNQIWKISYAQHQQVCQIDSRHIGKDTEKACKSLYPLHDVFVRKEKMLENSSSGKSPGGETGVKVEQADGYDRPVQESV
ncbi:hypothetical protein FD755_018527 [Muntiacus reevesi]|uniref:40S ribosomal protein S3a n=1 Tax=Muntiacus reevesi TaxID=9886 RepID=A0A5N3X787_MUNRE|nr:hypothetical protein FD755_018527 [Muntiacus reevesi]